MVLSPSMQCLCMYIYHVDIVFLYHVDADLEMFGSSANGFGSKTSDLDICLTLPGHDKVHTQICICGIST